MKKLLNNLFLWLLTIALTIGGFYSAYWGITQESLARSSKNWPSTMGTVTSSYIQVSRSKGGINHFPRIKYSYTIQKTNFANDRIYFGSISSRKVDAIKAMKDYPMGKSTVVYYDPSDPAVSCLDPGKYRTISSVSVIFGFTIFTVGFLIVMTRSLLFVIQRTHRQLE